MEEELETKLFNREFSGLILTFAGEQLLPYARKIQDLAEEAVQITSKPQTKKNTLRIGFISATLESFVTPMTKTFREICPDITVRLHELLPGEQIEQLRKGMIDVGIIGTPCGTVQDEFETMTLRELPQYAIMPASHRLAGRQTIELTDLREESIIGFNGNGFPGRNQLIQRQCQQAGFTPQINLLADGLLVLIGMVGSGEGVSIVPWDVLSLPHPNVVFLPLQGNIEPERLSAVWRRDDVCPALRCFLEAVRPVS